MKRYEKFSREEIVNLFTTASVGACGTCDIASRCPRLHPSCVLNMAEFLTKDIEFVPRIAKINTVEELAQVRVEHQRFCNKTDTCLECPYQDDDDDCFLKYLAEPIEVTE